MLSKVNTIYELLVVNKQKAVSSFIVVFLFTQAAQHGINLENYVKQDGLESLVFAALGYLAVYLKTNR